MWTSITDWLIAYKDSLGLILDISGFLVLLIGSISGLLKWKHSNAIKKAELQSFDEQVISFKTLRDAENFLQIFENQIDLYNHSLKNQINDNICE